MRRCGTSCRHRVWSAPPAGATARCEQRAGRRAGRAGAVSHKMVGGGGDRNAPSPAAGCLPPARRLGHPGGAARRAFGQQSQGLKCKCKVQLSPVFALCKTRLTTRLWETTYKRFKTRACLFLVFYLCKVFAGFTIVTQQVKRPKSIRLHWCIFDVKSTARACSGFFG